MTSLPLFETRMPAYSPPTSPVIASPAVLVAKPPLIIAPRATFSNAFARVANPMTIAKPMSDARTRAEVIS